MIYSNYLKRMSSPTAAMPPLDQTQMFKLLNIIAIEVRLEEVEYQQKLLKNNKFLVKRQMVLRKKLFEMTQLEAPYKLIEKMIAASHKGAQ